MRDGSGDISIECSISVVLVQIQDLVCALVPLPLFWSQPQTALWATCHHGNRWVLKEGEIDLAKDKSHLMGRSVA